MRNVQFGLLFLFCLLSCNTQAQEWQLLKPLLGQWSGTGTGFSGGTSTVSSSFSLVLDKNFIEVKNQSVFEAVDENSPGSTHMDWGMISYDSDRESFVFRQFHNEGYINQYILNDSLSDEEHLVFESEIIENFVEGGKARWTINLHSKSEIETVFDVSFPGQDYACFGTNKLIKVKVEDN